ncbi:hypothetical protein ACSFBI_20785 [Variovorax sp. RB3P1]|uniref:hypothetical protein n=1 Tax=Variovorax sp. RB3P1 TaxID=3443732 RepID=UPI003F449717
MFQDTTKNVEGKIIRIKFTAFKGLELTAHANGLSGVPQIFVDEPDHQSSESSRRV